MEFETNGRSDGRTDGRTKKHAWPQRTNDVQHDRRRHAVSTSVRHEQTDEPTDAANRIRCILALIRDIWWQ